CLFFFSSRRRHTRWPRDWSSDVCSSDLVGIRPEDLIGRTDRRNLVALDHERHVVLNGIDVGDGCLGEHDGTGRRLSLESALLERSEERRVGKECGDGWWSYDYMNV